MIKIITVIYIKRDNKPISVGINYNDLGQFNTSRHRLRYFLNTHNIFGLNESLDFSYQNKLQRQYKERDTKILVLGYLFLLNIGLLAIAMIVQSIFVQ